MPATTPERLKRHLADLGKKYPDIWRQVDEFRSGRGKSLPLWSEWCFLPLAAGVAIVTDGAKLSEIHPANFGIEDVAKIGAFAAWRATQGVYRFHPELFRHVWETPVTGELPVDLFFRLPEWCVYVEAPGQAWHGRELFGFFVHLEEDQNDLRRELRFLMDTAVGLVPYILHLSEKNIPQALEKAFMVGAQVAVRHGIEGPLLSAAELERMALTVRPCVSLVLYLCSVSSEVRDAAGSVRQPGNPKPTKTKKGLRMFPAEKLTAWEVGYRIGAALESSLQETARRGTEGTHASPRPHIRRAHWHTFRTGSRNQPENQRSMVKWLPPIPVGTGELVPTIKPVK